MPYKGQVLTETARYWFARTEDICANHVLADPAPNVSVVRRLRMLPVEMVVRDYLTGSTETRVQTHYSHQMTAAARAIAAMKFLMLRSKRVAIRRQSLRRQNMRSMMLRCL